MKKNISQINFLFAAVLIIFLPFQTLFASFLSKSGYGESVVFWLSHWYEPVLIVLFSIATILAILNKERLRLGHLITFLLIIFSIFSVLYLSHSIGRGIEGFRFDFLSIVAFGLIFLSYTDERQKKSLLNLYLFVALIIAIWAIIERILPINYWQNWFNIDNFGFGNDFVGDSGLVRSASFIGGPNQLGAYLIPAFFIALGKIIESWKARNIIFYSLLGLAVGFSYSRAALVGLLAGFAFFAFYFILEKPIKKFSKFWVILSITFAIVAVPFATAAIGQHSVRSILTHDSSNSGHVTSLKASTEELKNRFDEPVKLFFGSGLGTAGPLVIKYNDGIVSESWYLQILLETGIIGTALWLVLIIIMLVNLMFKSNGYLALGIVGVSVSAIFLHTFADNVPLTFTLFVLAGLLLSKDVHEKNSN
jgi:O-antigen ligase